jgi:hypothetical protein
MTPALNLEVKWWFRVYLTYLTLVREPNWIVAQVRYY